MTFRRTRCPHCRGKLDPGQRIHPLCIEPWADSQQAKAERAEAKRVRAAVRVEKAQTRAKLRDMETPKKLLPKAQRLVNRWCRLRDMLAGRSCISCGATYRAAFGGVFDAGHFRSVGSAPHMRFFTPQIRLQCVRCNRDLSGNTVEFRKGLVALLGLAYVERIEGMYWIQKWTVDYLRRLMAVAKKRGDRLEKRLREMA